MKKLILVLMAMLLMASIASASFEAYYRDEVSPYKMKAFSNTYRITMDPTSGHDFNIDFNNGCDVGDVMPPVDADGRLPCVEISSPYSDLTLLNLSSSQATKMAFATSTEVKDLSNIWFDVFYKSEASAFSAGKMVYINASRIVLTGVEGERAVVNFESSCDISDAIDRTPPIDIDGSVACLKVSTPTQNIALTNETTTIRTKEIYIYMHSKTSAPVTPPEPIGPTCTDTDEGQNIFVAGTVTDTAPGMTVATDYCAGDRNSVYEGWCDDRDNYRSLPFRCPGECREGACLPTCNDREPLNDVHAVGTVNGTDATGIDFDWADECDTASAKVIEGKCIVSSDGLSLVDYEYKDCPTGEVCSLGKCIVPLSGDKLREKLWEDIRSRLMGIKLHLNNIEKSACGTGLPTGKAVAANNAVTVNSFSNLEVELTKIYEQQARIAKCKGLTSAKFTKAATSEKDVAALIAVTTKQTFDLKKATLKAGGKTKEEQGKKTPAGEKTPREEQEKTPAGEKTPATKTSFWSKVFGKKTPAGEKTPAGTKTPA